MSGFKCGFFHSRVHTTFVFKFSLQGSPYVNCPFQAGESKGGNLLFCLSCVFSISAFLPVCADTPSWEVYLGPVGQSVFLYLSSSTPATFSAQLCVLEDRTCTPVGEIHSVAMVSARLYSRGLIYVHMHSTNFISFGDITLLLLGSSLPVVSSSLRS